MVAEVVVDMWGVSHVQDIDRAAWSAEFIKVTTAYEKSVERETKVWLQDGKVSEAYIEAAKNRSQAFWLWRAWLDAYNGFMDWIAQGRQTKDWPPHAVQMMQVSCAAKYSVGASIAELALLYARSRNTMRRWIVASGYQLRDGDEVFEPYP
jgi:hypothetical protein